MLKILVAPSTKLLAFFCVLMLALTQPQMQHLVRMVEAILVCDSRKTLTNLTRQWVAEWDPKNAADFLRESTWDVAEMAQARRQAMLQALLARGAALGLPKVLFIGIDDSLGKKAKTTRHLAAVDWHHDHTESTRQHPVYANGSVFVEVHIQLGDFGFLYDAVLYLRESTVRRLNRQRAAGEARVSFRSKYALARAILADLAAQLPADYQVYALFDSWYASAKLIKYCRRQRWHVICALKNNRTLDGKQLHLHDQAAKQTRYVRTRRSGIATTEPASYYVRAWRGRLKDVPGEVMVLCSRRHPGDPRPKYFLCTDLTLAPQEILRNYEQRWPVEVDNLYLKEVLGLSDFRVQSLRAAQRWLAVVVLALNFLQYQQLHAPRWENLAAFVRHHRRTHAEAMLRQVAQDVLQTGDVETVVRRFLHPAPEGVT